jgi:four helix bundle protein
MNGFKDLIVYKKAFSLSMEIFQLSKTFPKNEDYSLTSQIRRSSRSVCSNISEGYRKRQYPAHFVSKISDVDMENSETQVWIDFALHCEYINEQTNNDLLNKSKEIENPEKYSRKNSR